MPLYLVPPSSPTGVLRYEWVDPTGTVRDLTHATSLARFVTRGSRGLGGPEVDVVVEKLPFQPGGMVRHVGIQPGRIELPLLIQEQGIGDLIGAVRTVRGWFRTGDERTRTPGYLRVTRPDDSVRQIGCFYAGGFEGDTSDGGTDWAPYVISLLAPDPYWTDPTDTVLTFAQGDTVSSWFDTPYIWGSLTASDVFSEPLVINGGDVEAYPVWTVTGPGTNPTAYNRTTGKLWQLNITLLAGETVTVDTRPARDRGNVEIIDNYQNNRLRDLSNTSKLWTLQAGGNYLTLSMGNTTGASSMAMAYHARYEGALR